MRYAALWAHRLETLGEKSVHCVAGQRNLVRLFPEVGARVYYLPRGLEYIDTIYFLDSRDSERF